ncbi:MAG: DUF4166 domain-containing protein [Pseudomonadota bacterium]|nr:DUF4166 domain-containing protein [Pseudomonadota bacterium]
MGAWPLKRDEKLEARNCPAPLLDLRFRRLIGREAWDALPDAVRKRFSKRLGAESVALYRGRVIRTEFSRPGWLLAQALRLVGAPLPTCRDTDVPAMVCVSEDMASGGQLWSRLYGRRRGFPQMIHSAKRFAGPTGLEEYVGRGIGMALRVEPMANGLRFVSDHYFLAGGNLRIRLPHWIEPGRTVVEHHDLGHGCFLFSLSLTHPAFGRLVEQHALFHDA